MVTKHLTQLQHAQDAAIFVCWKLMPGRSISLRPRQAGVLRIEQGQVWATVDGSPRVPANELGDHFLQAGQQMAVRAGQHLVFEPYGAANATPVYFEWTPLPESVTLRASRWHAAVMRPLRDLGQAVLMAGLALGQLMLGLAGYGEYLVAGRGRVLSKLEANQP